MKLGFAKIVGVLFVFIIGYVEIPCSNFSNIELEFERSYDLGTYISRVYVYDLENDGIFEIIITSSDEKRYIAVFGEEIILKEVFRSIDQVIALDIDDDGIKEIVTTNGKRDANHNFIGGSTVKVYDKNLNLMWEFETESNAHGLIHTGDRIIVGDCNCFLYELNFDGILMRKKKFAEEWCSIDSIAVGDIANDETSEIIFGRWFNTSKTNRISDIMMINTEWETLAIQKVFGIPRDISLSGDNIIVLRQKWGIIFYDAIYILKWTGIELKSVMIAESLGTIENVESFAGNLIYEKGKAIYFFKEGKEKKLCDGHYFVLEDIDKDGKQELIVIYKNKLTIFEIQYQIAD